MKVSIIITIMLMLPLLPLSGGGMDSLAGEREFDTDIEGSFERSLKIRNRDYLFSGNFRDEPGPHDIILGALIFDPLDEDLEEALPRSGLRECQYMVQFGDPVPSLHELVPDIEITDVLSRNTILITSSSRDIHEVLMETEWDPRAVADYHSAMIIEGGLYREMLDDDSGYGVYRVAVGSYERWARAESESMKLVLSMEHEILDPWTVIVELDRDRIGLVSRDPLISHISPLFEEDIDNDIAADIIGVTETWSTAGLDGSGQIIAVVDTGLDTGSNSTMHPDMKGRIRSAYAYGRTNNWSDPDIHIWDSGSGTWKYKGGHGTHVVGSVLGNGSASSGNYSGMAPEAELVMQSTMRSTGSLNIPAYSTLLGDAYNSGARIQTNSWSSRSGYANYTWKSWQIDNYLWSKKDLLVHFSAGNKGTSGPNMVSTQASSKNVIGVGASESYRPSISSSADNISQIAYFSSQGYTWGDGRVKPDVVAPGTYILSTRASTISDYWNHYWGNNATYNGVNSRYAYLGGTSMSTPIVAGMSGLIREYFQEEEDVKTPSSALVKAAVINGARPLNGDWSSIPNRYEGWGLVNISNSIATDDSDAGDLFFVDNNTGLSTGDSHFHNIPVSGGPTDMVMTLVWTDYPGSNTSSTKLVNDIDLTVTAPNGSVYYGNDLIAPFNSSRDRKNNVERIRIPSPGAGIYNITVSGHSVSKGPQPYAFVATMDQPDHMGVLSFDMRSVPANNTASRVYLSDVNLTGSETVEIKINSTTDPSGEYISMSEITEGNEGTGIFVGYFNVTVNSPGSSEIRVSGDETVYAHFNETYPARELQATTRALIVPGITSITFEPDDHILTRDENITVRITGMKDCSVFFSVEGMDGGDWIVSRDDGALPDELAGDGNYTGYVVVPDSLKGNFTLAGYIRRGDLHWQREDAKNMIRVNTDIPRVVEEITASPLPGGNSLLINWTPAGDPDISFYHLYMANESETGSGKPGNFSLEANISTGDPSHIVHGLVDETRYFFRITAHDTQGYRSIPSPSVSGVPYDTREPWVIWNSPVNGSVLAREVRLDISLENDTTDLIIQGAADSDSDRSPDGLWLDLAEMEDPLQGMIWNTSSLSSSVWEGKDVLLRVMAFDEKQNMNITAPLAWVRFDNTGPDDFSLDSVKRVIQNRSDYLLSAVTEPYAAVKVISDMGMVFSGTADMNGDVNMDIALEPGENGLEINVFDRYGNGPLVFNDRLLIVYDMISPHPEISWSGNMTSKTTMLSAAGSEDTGPDSDLAGISRYAWQIEKDGSLFEQNGSRISFVPVTPGLYTVTLIVWDNALNMAVLVKEMQVVDGISPYISKIDDIVMDEDSLLEISPFVEDDDPDIIDSGSFKWEIQGPEDHVILQRDLSIAIATPGEYSVNFEVTDTGGNRDEVFFDLKVEDITPPVVEAGGDRKVVRGESVLLSTPLSSDNDPYYPDGSRFLWEIDGFGLTIEGMEVSFSAGTLGKFTVELTITDRSGNSASDSFILEVATDGTPPVILYSHPADGSTGTDPEGELYLDFSETMDTDSTWEKVRLNDMEGGSIPIEVRWKDNDTRLIIIPDGPLVKGNSYTITIDDDLKDITGEPITSQEVSFTVRRQMVLVGLYSVSAESIDDLSLVLDDIADPVYLLFSDEMSPDSIIRLRTPDGKGMGELEFTHTGNGNHSLKYPEGLEPGDYIIDLSSVVSRSGENISGDDRIEIRLPERGDKVSGGGSNRILIVGLIVSILAAISGVGFFILRKRRSGKEGTVENEIPPGLAGPSSEISGPGISDFYPSTGNDKY